MTERPSGRAFDQLRDIELVTNVSKYAEGSCLAKFGDTHVLCTASIDSGTPRWLKGTGLGWVTAEYGMLPRATHSRMDREAARGKQSGRTQEIQRLIGRSLRAVVDLKGLGERTVTIDCDVLQADGGTRTAAITGGFVALADAVDTLLKRRAIAANPLHGQVAAVRVPPSAWMTSQSTLTCRSPMALRSVTARKDRPIRRWISWVRPLCLPRAASRSIRLWVARGSMPYSAVTQPSPVPFNQRGVPVSTEAVHSTWVWPNLARHEPSA